MDVKGTWLPGPCVTFSLTSRQRFSIFIIERDTMGTKIVENKRSSGEPLTFEKVWAMFQETDRKFQEIKELHKEVAESQKETDRQMKETDRQMKETGRLMQETDRRLNRMEKNLGGLGDSMGRLIETLIAARLWEKFSEYPYNLQRAYQRVYVYDEKNWAVTDIDILLSDTEWVMAVEVKREASTLKDIDHHIKRMKLIREYPPAEARGKKLLGAVAGGIIRPNVRDYAHSAGFFVLELKGESVALVPSPEGFSPKIW